MKRAPLQGSYKLTIRLISPQEFAAAQRRCPERAVEQIARGELKNYAHVVDVCVIHGQGMTDVGVTRQTNETRTRTGERSGKIGTRRGGIEVGEYGWMDRIRREGGGGGDCRSTVQHGKAQRSIAKHSEARQSTAKHSNAK